MPEPEFYLGKVLFFPCGHTFFQVEGVKRYSEEEMGGAVFLQVVEVNNPQKTSEFEPQEIGRELFLLPPDFPAEQMQAYQGLAAQRTAANEAMQQIAMGIVTYRQHMDDNDIIPFVNG